MDYTTQVISDSIHIVPLKQIQNIQTASEYWVDDSIPIKKVEQAPVSVNVNQLYTAQVERSAVTTPVTEVVAKSKKPLLIAAAAAALFWWYK